MCQNEPNLVIFKVKICAVFEKLMQEECKISIKESLLCCSLAQGTILLPKMVFKVSQGGKFAFQAQKWSKIAILAPLIVLPVSGQKF